MTPQVALCRTATQFAYLVVTINSSPSSSTPETTYLFTIDTQTGILIHAGIPNVDIFSSYESAKSSVDNSTTRPEWKDLGEALIGATVHSNTFVICTITKSQNCAFIFKQPIRIIEKVIYTEIQLSNGQASQDPFWKKFPLKSNHYYCPSLCLSNPFPYRSAQPNSDFAFCWNTRWHYAFRAVSALRACVILLQGLAASYSVAAEATPNLTYILKRSATNPGTRYNARGFNETADPANECECELIFTLGEHYWATTWRRGSCPIKWRTDMRNLGLSVSHVVAPDQPSGSTSTYFGDLSLRLSHARLRVISLLLLDEHHAGEHALAQAYEQSVAESRDASGRAIGFDAFDLNTHLASGDDPSFTTLSEFLAVIERDVDGSLFTDCDADGNVAQWQELAFRFNCVDSLDRTNLATVYYAIFVVMRFGLQHDVFIRSRAAKRPTDAIELKPLTFIVDEFYRAGNIVSTMYTNTEAIKAAHMYRLVNREAPGAGDGRISARRRFQNVFSDEERQDILTQWTEQVSVFGSCALDDRHIAVAPGQRCCARRLACVGHAIVEGQHTFEITAGTDPEVFVVFPGEFVLAAVSLWLTPRAPEFVEMMVALGDSADSMFPFFDRITLPAVEAPQWVRFDLLRARAESAQFPSNPRACLAWRVVEVMFVCADTPFHVGTLRFEVVNPAALSGSRYEILPARVEVLKKRAFAEMMDGLLPLLGEIVQIELFRMQNGIGDQDRNAVLVEKGKSPFWFDLRGRIAARTKKCPSCGARPPGKRLFSLSRDYPNLLVIAAAGAPGAFAVCKQCAETILVDGTEQLLNRERRSGDKLVRVEQGVSQPVSSPREFALGNIAVGQYALFLAVPAGVRVASAKETPTRRANSVLAERGGECRFALTAGVPQQFVLALPTRTALAALALTLIEPAECAFSVLAPNTPLRVAARDVNGLQTVLRFEKAQAVEALILVFEGDGEVAIAMVDVRGQFCEARAAQPDVRAPAQAQEKVKKARGEWDAVQRVQRFAVSNIAKIDAVTFSLLSERYPVSLVIACYAGSECLVQTNLLLPEVKQDGRKGTALTIRLDFDVPRCTRVCVFYLDRVPVVEPHVIAFKWR